MEQFGEVAKNNTVTEENENGAVTNEDSKKGFKFRKLTKKEWAAIWDKTTTGLLILLMASPVLILLYIFSWFLSIAQF